MSDIDTRVSPDLHPAKVKHIEGYSEASAPFLAATETAFSTAYEGLRAVYETRAIVDQNPGWNDAQKVMQVSKFADKKEKEAINAFRRAEEGLRANIDKVEQELSAPVEAKATGTIAAEVRAYAKAMSNAPERHSFIMQAIEAGDATTLSALLGAPSYLSGLTVELQRTYVRQYREKMAPELAQRLKAMQGALTLIETRLGLMFKSWEKAVGAPPQKVAELRRTQAAALKALELN